MNKRIEKSIKEFADVVDKVNRELKLNSDEFNYVDLLVELIDSKTNKYKLALESVKDLDN